MVDRVATYRWQLTPDNGFAAAAAAAPDLAAIGVSHLYLSPIVEAVPGSTHGYDAVDPTRIRAELGGEEGFAALVSACRAAGLGIVLDIVPNHLAAHHANPWWWDVLRLGRRSGWAASFDVDWDPPKRALVDRVLLPVLGDHYGRELEAGQLRLEAGDRPGHLVVLRYHEHVLPVGPAATAAILDRVAATTGDDVLGVAARVLVRSVDDDVDPAQRDADLAVAERLALIRLATPDGTAGLRAELDAMNADPDRLHDLLEGQPYRLARWTVGDAELDYRRFFDVDTLVATRADDPAVFDAIHELPVRLADDGAVDGLRVDHVDGLRDPQGYLERLRAATGDGTWLLVEKILRSGEALPAGWPVGGTTGYEVADLLGGWLTDPAGGDRITAGWRQRTGESRSFEEVALECRREVLATVLAADVERVVDGLVRVCEQRRRHRDHTRRALHAAVTEVAAHAPAYRSYVAPDGAGGLRATPADAAFVATAVEAARDTTDLEPELLDLVHDVLLGRLDGNAEQEVALRFQQLTGPVAAKGEEDTALYRWLPLPHRCEVGADPARPSVTVADWHEAAAEAQEQWPERLTTLSTHDTKRSADARARLAALTTVADEVLAAFDAWWAATAPARDGSAGSAVDSVDPGTGWMVFHALVAAHPLSLVRAWPVVEKSAREAGMRTSWTRTDEGFEAALHQLVVHATADPACTTVVGDLVDRLGPAADAAALAQAAVQLLAPGIPDVYQGGEAWDRSLVDPDNRRPLDAARRQTLLEQADAVDAATAWADPGRRADGTPRLALLRAALHLRRRHPAAVGPGPAGRYEPIDVSGPDRERVLAFHRGGAVAVVVARPGPGGHVGADAQVTLPHGTWRDVLTGARHGGPTTFTQLTGSFPVALLEQSDR